MSDTGIYVYGIVTDGALTAAPELTGIDGSHPVECVTDGDVCVLVSRVSLAQFDEQSLRERLADMSWVEQTARRHQQVLEAVLDRCTPVPMRLCTVYRDEDSLRQMLDREQGELTAVLSELKGKLEWGVKVFAGSRPEPPPTAVTPGAESGTAYLQNRLAARQAGEQSHANLEQACDRLHADLAAIAVASRLGALHRPEVSGHTLPMILNAFYLVANEQREAFRERVAELGGKLMAQGIDLQLTGPWAPYNFVPAAVGGAQ